MSSPEPEFSVLGCGVAALTCATMLHESGFKPEVVVPHHAPAPVSHLAGGMLAPFCEGDSAPSDVVNFGQHALSWWSTRVPDVKQNGTLVVAPSRDQSELDRFSRHTTHHRWVSPGDIEPDIANQFSRGLFFPNEGHLDPRQALAFLELQLRSAKISFKNVPSTSNIIDCRALQAKDGLSGLRGVRGDMLVVKNPHLTLSRPVRLLHPRFPCYIVPRDKGLFMIGATMIETCSAGHPTAQSIMELLSAAYTMHPSFAQAEIIEMKSGVRPAFADNIPRVIHINGRWHVNGMYRHGFLMAPHCAEELVRRIKEA